MKVVIRVLIGVWCIFLHVFSDELLYIMGKAQLFIWAEKVDALVVSSPKYDTNWVWIRPVGESLTTHAFAKVELGQPT